MINFIKIILSIIIKKTKLKLLNFRKNKNEGKKYKVCIILRP